MSEYMPTQSFEGSTQQSAQRMDYAFTLLRHLDRISAISTSIDAMETPAPRIRSLEVSIYLLRQGLAYYWDEDYTKEMGEILKRPFEEDNWQSRQKNVLDAYGVCIKLMARLGLLLKTQVEDEMEDDVDPLLEKQNDEQNESTE